MHNLEKILTSLDGNLRNRGAAITMGRVEVQEIHAARVHDPPKKSVNGGSRHLELGIWE